MSLFLRIDDISLQVQLVQPKNGLYLQFNIV